MDGNSWLDIRGYNHPMFLLISRVLIVVVTFINLQCATLFIFTPQAYISAFELSGEPGIAALRGIGVLFVMWNVPYLVALVHPVRYRLALMIALIMQGIGLAGESFIYISLPIAQIALRASITRFIIFDAIGFLFLFIAFFLSRKPRG